MIKKNIKSVKYAVGFVSRKGGVGAGVGRGQKGVVGGRGRGERGMLHI